MSDLKHVEGRVVISVDIESKNVHAFSNGHTIRIERNYNNLNFREVHPVNAIVVSAKDIPAGVQILVHHNTMHDVNRILNYKKISGKEEASDVKYYSVRETDCFLWLHESGEWMPIKPYETALRVFKPYEGILHGIDPKEIKDVLFVTSGDLKGEAVKTIKASDYQIVFQGVNNQEQNIIRFRPHGDADREPEAIAILHDLTKKVNNGKLLVGLTIKDAKPIHKLIEAD